MIWHRVPSVDKAPIASCNRCPTDQTHRALESSAQYSKKSPARRTSSPKLAAAIDQEVWDLRVAVLGPERAAIRSPEDGKRSPVDVYWLFAVLARGRRNDVAADKGRAGRKE